VRPRVLAVLAAVLVYVAHRSLKAQYHRQCGSDIIRVVLFSQSTMCSHIGTLLQVVEVVCGQAVGQLTSHVFGALSSLVTAGASKAAGHFAMPAMF
jgi:hypothetical protein